MPTDTQVDHLAAIAIAVAATLCYLTGVVFGLGAVVDTVRATPGPKTWRRCWMAAVMVAAVLVWPALCSARTARREVWS